MDDRVLPVKYELYYEGIDERVGKTDLVEVTLDTDAELVAFAFREAVHVRRRVRDLNSCSAANLRVFPESNPEEELQDEDFLRFLLDGAPEKIRVVAPQPPKGAGNSNLSTNRSRSIGSIARASAEFGSGGVLLQGVGTPSSRRESSGGKRGESDSIVVFVKTGDANFPVEVQRSATVEAVKARIKEQEQIPLHQQRLMHGGVELESDRTLFEYNIQQGSELQLVLMLGSGSS